MSRPFTPSWLAGEPTATAFLARGFTDADARRRASDAVEPLHAEVWETLAAQEAKRPQSAARSRNLQRLRDGAVALVTGQQVGLFLGPLYTLHKAATCVVDALALEAETGRAVVPVFWLQTEDHDLEEVRACEVVGARGVERVEVAGDGERVSLAHRVLGPSLATALETLKSVLQGPHAGPTYELIAQHYRPERTFAEAFGDLVADLFADHGLIVFDPRPDFCAHARSVHDFALTHASAIARALSARAHALSAAGFDVQVPIREDAPLSCIAPSATGPRTRATLADHVHLGEPERFTTTALLRPLLQDTLLPTVGYIGGPGELAYFAELPPLYELAGRPMPLAIPRARFRLVSATARRLAEQLGLQVDDAAFSKSELAARIAPSSTALIALEATFARLDAQLGEGFTHLAQHAEELGDSGFAKQGKKTEELVRAALTKLLDRSRRMALELDELASDRLARFTALLAPRGEPQERVLGFATFAAQIGAFELVDRIVASVTPFDGSMRIINL